MGALWVRGHIGIPGKEHADLEAYVQGYMGTRWGGTETTTFEGMKGKRREWRRTLRVSPWYGKNRSEWGEHALAAYSWTRTNRGPQKAWLHHIGKSEDPSCPYGHPSQDGDHLVFQCPMTEEQRRILLPPGATTWEALDNPNWITRVRGSGSGEEKEECTEVFFQQMYWLMRPGEEEEEGEEEGAEHGN